MAELIAETRFYEEPKYPASTSGEGGINVHRNSLNVNGHVKQQLCVSHLGHSMLVPPRDGAPKVKFGELFRRHRLKTISYCAVFWSFGTCVAFLGPTLLDLECKLEALLSTMSWIFFSQALFILIGAACGGFLTQIFSNNVILLVSIVMISVTLSIIPTCTVLIWLSVVLAVMGFFMGTIDTVANISMIQLYGKNVAPFLQALHFCYGFGAFVSPLVAKPFLLNKDCSEIVENVTYATHSIHMLKKGLPDLRAEITEAQNDSKIEYAFWILSVMQIPIILLLLINVLRDVWPWGRNYKLNPGFTETKEGIEMSKPPCNGADLSGMYPDHYDDDRPAVTKEQMVLIVVSTVALLFIYDGLQAGYADYIYSYAVKSVPEIPNYEAAYLNSCFWGTFALGRLLSIGLATRLAPVFMLSINIAGCLVSMILLLCFRHNHVVLYIGTGLFGMFLSSSTPTAVSLAETYINITSFIMSLIVAAASTGEMVLPVIFGYEFDGIGPISLLISCLIMILLSIFIYVFFVAVGENIIRQSSERSILKRIRNLFKPPDNEEITEDSGLLKHHTKYYKRMTSEVSESDFIRTSPVEKSIFAKSPSVEMNGGLKSPSLVQVNGAIAQITG